MTAKQKLIKFMEMKQEKLKTLFKDKKGEVSFFTEEDKAEVEKWKEIDCKKLWNELTKNVGELTFKRVGLLAELCPFCLKYLKTDSTFRYTGCSKCTYALNHKECDEENSDNTKLYNLQIRDNVKMSSELTSSFYRKVIHKIETLID